MLLANDLTMPHIILVGATMVLPVRWVEKLGTQRFDVDLGHTEALMGSGADSQIYKENGAPALAQPQTSLVSLGKSVGFSFFTCKGGNWTISPTLSQMPWLSKMIEPPAQSLLTDLRCTKVRKPLEVRMPAVPALAS